ncbi:MAG TPA: hypothetical protein VF808_17600 [Ktedonobacterales bacterium]
MLRGTRGIELAAGWLAVIAGVAIMGDIWLSGFIDPSAVVADLLAYGLMLALIALGVTLDVQAPNGATKAVALVMLTLGTLALTGWFVISFVVLFGAPALLAIIATALSYARLGSREVARVA